MATIVAFHAHPDDEVLLTGGTIARLAAEGRRVIIVMACDGDMWDGPVRAGGRGGSGGKLFARLARPLLLLRLLTGYRAGDMRGYGMPRSAITHRVDVRRHGAQKRAALAAHWGQVSGWGPGARLMLILLRLPWPAFRVALGTEWFAEPGGRTGELVPRDQPAGPGRS